MVRCPAKTHVRQHPCHQNLQGKSNQQPARSSDYRRYHHSRYKVARQHAIERRRMSNRSDALRSKVPVVILLLRRRVRLGFLFWWLGRQHVDRVFIRGVDVRLGGRHGHLDFVRVLARLDDAKICIDLVVALRTPRNIAGREEV